MLASKQGLPCNIFRLGLVWADSQAGRYDELQRGYRLLESCILSGCAIRNFRFETPPIPVDYVARSIVYLATRHPDGRGIFHIASKDQLINGVFEHCNTAGLSLRLMSYYEWTREIKRLHYAGLSLPIVPLIEALFPMDEASFHAYQKDIASMEVSISCDRTQAELEHAGIIAPAFTDEMIRLSVERLLSARALRQNGALPPTDRTVATSTDRTRMAEHLTAVERRFTAV
jgi:thioester reductase-like protein